LLPSLKLSAQDAPGPLPRSAPEAQGISSAAVLEFLDAIAKSKHEFHGFVLARHGHVVSEGWWAPYRPSANHMLYSLSKSFTSTAIGLAVTEGRLTVDDPVLSFFPDKAPANPSANLSALRVKHLLMMSVGHATDSTPIITREHDWVKSFLSLPIAREPGSVFLYNSGATYMLSAIVQKITGQKVIDYLRPRLFEPLAIENMTWETCPMGINTGGWGLSVQTESIARFAQLYLRQGRWNDRQIIPAAWVHEATTFKIQQRPGPGGDLEKLKQTSDWHQGYCYQFWRCRHNGFRGDGAFGQFAIVLPEQDAVIAINAETGDMQGEINLVWDHLLPAMKDAPLRADDAAHTQLQSTLAALALPLAPGGATSDTATAIDGKTFALAENPSGFTSVTFDFERDRCGISFRQGVTNHTVNCGLGKWIDGTTSLPGLPPKLTVGDLRPARVAASAGWTDPSTLKMLWRFFETPHHESVTCQIDGDKINITCLDSLTEKNAHPEPHPIFTGRLAAV